MQEQQHGREAAAAGVVAAEEEEEADEARIARETGLNRAIVPLSLYRPPTGLAEIESEVEKVSSCESCSSSLHCSRYTLRRSRL